MVMYSVSYFFPLEAVALAKIGFYPLLEFGRSFFSLLNIRYKKNIGYVLVDAVIGLPTAVGN